MHEDVLEALRGVVKDVAISMLSMEVAFGDAAMDNGNGFHPSSGEALAVVRLRDGLNGGVRLSGDLPVLGMIYSAFLGEPFDSFNDEAKDAIGEFLNIIAGGLQEQMAPLCGDIGLSPPQVVMKSDDPGYADYLDGVHQQVMVGNQPFFIEVFF